MGEFQLRQSKRNQGFPPNFPPPTGEGPMESTDQGAGTNSQVEGSLVVESGEQFTSYVNPLV